MKPHQLKDVINAFADGKVIQFFAHGEWVDEPCPCFSAGNDPTRWRIKPAAPVVEYPVTRMADNELTKFWCNSQYGIYAAGCLRTVADAAIRHAIDAGQVVIPKAAPVGMSKSAQATFPPVSVTVYSCPDTFAIALETARAQSKQVDLMSNAQLLAIIEKCK